MEQAMRSDGDDAAERRCTSRTRCMRSCLGMRMDEILSMGFDQTEADDEPQRGRTHFLR